MMAAACRRSIVRALCGIGPKHRTCGALHLPNDSAGVEAEAAWISKHPFTGTRVRPQRSRFTHASPEKRHRFPDSENRCDEYQSLLPVRRIYQSCGLAVIAVHLRDAFSPGADAQGSISSPSN
jgi:hypothetical protein